MAGKPAAVVINTVEIIVQSAGSIKKESLNKYYFSPKKKNTAKEHIFIKKLTGVLLLKFYEG